MKNYLKTRKMIGAQSAYLEVHKFHFTCFAAADRCSGCCNQEGVTCRNTTTEYVNKTVSDHISED